MSKKDHLHQIERVPSDLGAHPATHVEPEQAWSQTTNQQSTPGINRAE